MNKKTWIIISSVIISVVLVFGFYNLNRMDNNVLSISTMVNEDGEVLKANTSQQLVGIEEVKKTVSELPGEVKSINRKVEEIDGTVIEIDGKVTVLPKELEALGNGINNLKESVDEFILRYGIELEGYEFNDQTMRELVEITIKLQELSEGYGKIEEYVSSMTYKTLEEGKLLYELAQNVEFEPNLRAIYYVNAINHDPENIEYFDGFYSFISGEGISEEVISTFLDLVNSSVYYSSAASTEHLIDLMGRAEGLLYGNQVEEVVIDHSVQIENLDKITNDINYFIKGTDCKNVKKWNQLYYKFYDEYYQLTDDETENYVDVVRILESLKPYYDMYSSVLDTVTRISSIDRVSNVDLYIASVESSSPVIVDSLQVLAVRSGNLLPEVNRVIDELFKDLNRRYDRLIIDYDNALIVPILQKANVVMTRVNNIKNVTYDKTKQALDDLTLEASLMQRKISGKNSLNDINEINSILAKCSQKITEYNYKNYQLWAADMLKSIKIKYDDAKKNERLYTLYINGFYNIDRKMLIPNLGTLYDEMNDKSNIDNSRYSLESIIKLYPPVVVQVGDYTKMRHYI